MDMQLAHYWAQVFGPFLIVMGIWMLFYHDNMTKIMTSIKNSPACFHLLGVLQFLLGMIMVTQCNLWQLSLALLVTLLGWLFIVRGVMSLFFPQVLMKMMHQGKGSRFCGVVPLVWGIALFWFTRM